jgi:hypothetical protein
LQTILVLRKSFVKSQTPQFASLNGTKKQWKTTIFEVLFVFLRLLLLFRSMMESFAYKIAPKLDEALLQ